MITATIKGIGKVSKLATFLVNIVGDEGEPHRRIVPTKIKSAYMAEIAGVIYACGAVDKGLDLTAVVSSPHIAKALTANEDGSWPDVKSASAELVDQARVLVTGFKSFKCVVGSTEVLDPLVEIANRI